MDFVNLHSHSIYSVRDAISKPKELIARAVELGMPAIALTDHGTIGGVMEFSKEAIKQGIKPIVGCEVYMATRSRFDKENKIDKYYHLTLLTMNQTGYKNLCRLISESYKKEHFYRKPRIDRELLRKYNEGLICLSGCLAGNLAHSILKEKNIEEKNYTDEAGNFNKPSVECSTPGHDDITEETFIQVIDWHFDVFGDRYYLEIQNHGILEEDIVRDTILNLAYERKIKVVATGDTHFVNKVDVKAHNIMLAIRDRKSIYDEDFSGYPGDGYSLPDEQYLKDKFSMAPETVFNTLEVAERCNLKLDLGSFKIPRFIDVYKEDDIFANEAIQGLKKKFPNGAPLEYEERLQMEIKTIQQMTYPSYFLIVQDYIQAAKSRGIPVGPGRGSAAGSLVSYCLGITNVDPLEYDLSFSRFLNKGRSAVPQINFSEYSIKEWKKNNFE